MMQGFCKMAACCGPGTKARVESVVAVKESCVLFKSGQHALFISWSRLLDCRASTD